MMKETQWWLGLVCLLAINVSAQQDNNWYFGRMAALNFSTGKPVAIVNSEMDTMEGSAAISDHNGQVLFYTNGIDVWNKNNVKMPHGTGLLGDQSTTQSAVIVPKPGSSTHYYIFAADDAGGPNGLTYSEVDMAADNGNGDVILANVPLVNPVTEKITAVYHDNGEDIWVTTHGWGNNTFYSYLVTASGVSNIPIISNVGSVIEGADNSGHYAGWMSISPNGKRLASVNGLLNVELFDFNNQTGLLSNAVVVKSPAKCYGVEFSPNSKLLYVTGNDNIFQYNITATDVAATQKSVGSINVASSIKLGPDSKIYLVSKYLAGSLSVINNPNIEGTGCNFVTDAVDLGGKKTFVGLPNFVVAPYYLLDIDTEHDCNDTEVSFMTIGTVNAESVIWDFGDGNQSTSQFAVHTYAATGTYTVKAKAKSGKETRYFTKQVVVVKAPVANKPDDVITCSSANGEGIFNLAQMDSAVLGSQSSDLFTVSYYLTETDAAAGTNALPANYNANAGTTTVYARVSRNNSDCYAVTSFNLTVVPSPVLEMDDTYGFCEDSYVVIEAPEGFDSYEWTFEGKTVTGGNLKSVDKPGEYTLRVTRATGNLICDATKIITVHESQKPVIKNIDIKDWSDNNNSIDVITASVGDYEYSIDGTVYQDSPLFENLEPGQYNVAVRDKNGCGMAQDEVLLLMYPRYFTPNGDGFHDKWQVDNAWFTQDLAITIVDRYGRIMASFKGNSPGWDGTYNGAQLPATDYWFIITRKNGKEYKGHFAMMR